MSGCTHAWELPPSDRRGRWVARCRLCGARREEKRPKAADDHGFKQVVRDPHAAGVTARLLKEDGI